MSHGVKLVVNLVQKIGGWQCSQYWPTEQGRPMEEGNILVALLAKEQVNETLTRFELEVTVRGSEISREVTLLHFNGWPDLCVPTSGSQLDGFN